MLLRGCLRETRECEDNADQSDCNQVETFPVVGGQQDGKLVSSRREIKGRKLPFLDADHAALALAARVTMKGVL